MPGVFIFVHIGQNPSPSLKSMAQVAKAMIENARIILITDFPQSWTEFPGEVLEYKERNRHEFILKFASRYPELEGIAGGYWLYTLERLFALTIAYDAIPAETAFVHLESDVALLMNQDDFELLVEKSKRTACPRHSEKRGIASVFFVPNQSELELTLEYFTKILNGPKGPTNDMDLLGMCLNSNLLDELPTKPWDAWQNIQGEYLVFDGAAYGQYLFGQDPFHTDGRRISGFVNPDFPINLEKTKWAIEEQDNLRSPGLTYNFEGQQIRVLNLHVHSKISLLSPSMSDSDWYKAINEANGSIARIADPYQQNKIHTGKISTINRFRLARRRGLAKTAFSALTKRIKRLINKIMN